MSTGSMTPGILPSYTLGEHLGSGFQGSVYRAVRKSDGRRHVVKILTANEERGLSMARNEVALLKRIAGHDHLAKIVDSCEEYFL
jgi:serine/threonine protein kinase